MTNLKSYGKINPTKRVGIKEVRMKLSSKSRYGLRAMCELASNLDEVMSISQIATATNTSEAYLEQLMALLRKANLVNSIRGAGGGYRLAKSPEEISVGSILRVLEDDLEFVECISGECSNKCNCKNHIVWQKLYDVMNESLDGVKLSEISNGGCNG